MLVSFDQSEYAVTEDNETTIVCIQLQGNLERLVRVNISTSSEGIAIVNSNTDLWNVFEHFDWSINITEADLSDYVPLRQELTFSSDALLQCVSISILVDDIVEQDERVIAALASSDIAVSIDQTTATITIMDSDKCM